MTTEEKGFTFKFHTCVKERHFNGICVGNLNTLEIEGFYDFFVMIRERNQISSYMYGYMCDLASLADEEWSNITYLCLDSISAVLSDSFLFAMEHAEYLSYVRKNEDLYDSYLFVLLDVYVKPSLRNKGYFTAMMQGIDVNFGDANITILGVSDFEADLSRPKDIYHLEIGEIEDMYVDGSLRKSDKQFFLNKEIAKKQGFHLDSKWKPSATEGLYFAIRDYYKM